MSAFVVEDKTINAVVSWLHMDRDSDYMRRQILRETGCNLETEDGCRRLGQAMFELNCNAINQRYGPDAAKDFRNLDYAYSYTPAQLLAAYKALRCWNYQCSEGDVPETSLLYATMQRVSAEIAHVIVSRLPQYETAGVWA